MAANYIARIEGAEGKVFYDNLLTSGAYVKKYFPPTAGESLTEYSRRPKISIPISSSIIDRITNILLQDIVISTNSDNTQEILDKLLIDLKLKEFIRSMILNSIVTGNNLAVIRVVNGKLYLENWDGTYVYISEEDGISGYEYTKNDGLIVPVLSSDVKAENRELVIIDELIFGNQKHNLPFNPSVLTSSVDKYDDNLYGKSFISRFKDLVIEYNQIASQMSKSIKILQNVWVTNLSVDNPEYPVRISPDRINFLGNDGRLEQAVRNLDLTEERSYLEILEHQISRASQVPAELAGLKDAGKLPSGIALQILLQPLVELTERLRSVFLPAIEELSYKVLGTELLLQGQAIPNDLEVGVQVSKNIFSEDRTDRISEIVLLKKEGLLSLENAMLLLEPILGIDLLTTDSNNSNNSNGQN